MDEEEDAMEEMEAELESLFAGKMEEVKKDWRRKRKRNPEADGKTSSTSSSSEAVLVSAHLKQFIVEESVANGSQIIDMKKAK